MDGCICPSHMYLLVCRSLFVYSSFHPSIQTDLERKKILLRHFTGSLQRGIGDNVTVEGEGVTVEQIIQAAMRYVCMYGWMDGGRWMGKEEGALVQSHGNRLTDSFLCLSVFHPSIHPYSEDGISASTNSLPLPPSSSSSLASSSSSNSEATSNVNYTGMYVCMYACM